MPTGVLVAQRLAGNRAVAGMLGRGTRRTAEARPRGRDVTVQRQPPKVANPTTAVHEDMVVTADDATNRATAEQRIVAKGWPDTRGWLTRFINMDPAQEMRIGGFGQGVSPETVKAMRASLNRTYDALTADRAKFLKDFEARSVATGHDVLNAAEKQIRDQLSALGIKARTFLGFKTGSYDMDAQKSANLRAAARELAGKKREADTAARAYLKVKGEADAIFNKSTAPALAESMPDVFLSPELKHRLDTARETGLKQADEYDKLCAERQQSHPILATFSSGWSAAQQLEDLANRDVGDMATKVATVANEKLENIAKVRGELGGRFSVWKEPHLRELTKKAMVTTPWQGRIAEEQAKEVAAAAKDTEMLLAIMAVGLGLVAAIPTAGASVAVAAVVATAAIGSMALSVYGAYQHYQNYAVQSAAQGTAFDRAQAISQGEPPELFWLAVEIATAILDIGAAGKALKAVNTAIREARAAESAAKLTEAIDASKAAGLSAETTGKVAAAAMGGGGEAKIVKSLEQLATVFKAAAKKTVGDAELMIAFSKAADKAIAEGKVALYMGSKSERRAAVLAQLRKRGVAEAALEARADSLMKTIEKSGVGGIYDPLTDSIFLRQDRSGGAVAAVLAHELAHAKQELVVGLGRLNTLEAEFTAFYAQKQFLMNLGGPAERWPKAYAWLATADNAAIESHIMSKYSAKGEKLRLFKNYDDAGAWILNAIKTR